MRLPGKKGFPSVFPKAQCHIRIHVCLASKWDEWDGRVGSFLNIFERKVS